MKLALLTAAVNGDNSGDAIIESAVRRLLPAKDILRFPLTIPLNDEDLAAVNRSDALIICGTNLYQHVFACNLTAEAVEKIKVPIIPFGIGSSASIGAIPKMDRAGIAAVRAIHRKCVVSSVRDEASLKFLHSIGIKNVILSGCPVLFHGLSCPDFSPSGEGFTLTPRARLLHIEEKWNARQNETLEFLCKRYHPSLVLQSPYDLPIADMLSEKYGVDVLMDENWQAETYIKKAREQSVNIGFRLHFAMLSISYGKPSYLVAHDSRASEFCKLLGLPIIDIRNYSDNALAWQVDARTFDGDVVRKRWDELSVKMAGFMSVNGLNSNLISSASGYAPKVNIIPQQQKKPRVLMLVDVRDWAFDISARQIARKLRPDFDFDIKYVRETPNLDPSRYDLLYVFFWGETYYQKFGFDPERIIKEVSSHRWEDNPLYGPCSPADFAARYLNDCSTVICTSLRLHNLIRDFHPNAHHTPNGISHSTFKKVCTRSGSLTIGWAGNIKDEVKGYGDILEPACRDRFRFMTAEGNLSHSKMNAFYNQLDVLVICSRHEGEPLTLIEAMAAGCFPVCTDVGIVPELIDHGVNGYIVSERTPDAFARAFAWCEANLDKIRIAGEKNARIVPRERNWDACAQSFKRVFLDVYNNVLQPKFRNDDVSGDTSLEEFKKFCEVFHKYGLTQVHGITLRGNTNTLFKYVDTPAEYDGYDTVANLDNQVIRELSDCTAFEERSDLIDYLGSISDEIALHGLFHVDYSKMTYDEQKDEILLGLDILHKLFPQKKIIYFIPPFNRTNEFTYKVCGELKLKVLTTEGVHLESELDRFVLRRNTWYRYHHHRFYPESVFSCYDLTLEKLDVALGKSMSGWQKYSEHHHPASPGVLSRLVNLVDRICH